MAINFPNTPSAGDPHSEGGVNWTYDGEKWVSDFAVSDSSALWEKTGTTLSPVTAGDDVDLGTGDLSAAAGTFSDDVIVSSTGVSRGISVSPDPAVVIEGTDSSSTTQLIANNSVTGHGILAFGRSRGGMGSFNSVVSDDTLGRIDFYAATGTTYELGASIQGRVQGTPSPGLLTTAIDFNTNNGVNFNRRMQINPSGDLLIGGTLPSSPNITLNQNGSASFEGSVYAAGGFGAGTQVINARIWNRPDGASNSDALYIGNARIGTTTRSELWLEPDNPANFNAENEYTGPTLDVKDRILNLISRLDALEANEVIDDATDTSLLQLLASASARLDSIEARLTALEGGN